MKRRPRDPEREARWAEARRQVEQRLEQLARERERRERRRERLRQLTFGLLGR
jgi:hypothetical protein